MNSPELTAWLEAHGLGGYAGAFAENEIALGDLPLLSDADLRELGLPMGPRKRLMAAVAAMGASLAVGAQSTASTNAPARSELAGRAERRQLTVMFCDLVGSTDLPVDVEAVVAG